MVDIAAQLSLTPSTAGFDSAAISGAETADTQAFGDILAGQVAERGGAKADKGVSPGNPLAPAFAAGNRQPGGKILPDAAQLLPNLSAAPAELPVAAALTVRVAAAALKNSPALVAVADGSQADKAQVDGTQVDGTQVDGIGAGTAAASDPALLAKVLAQVVRGRGAAKDTSAEPDAPLADGDAAEQAAASNDPAVPTQAELAVVPILVAATAATIAEPLVPAAPSAPASARAGATLLPVAVAADAAEAALREPAQQAGQGAPNQPGQAQPLALQLARAAQAPMQAPVQAPRQASAQAETQGVPVLTVPAATAETAAAPITLAPAQPGTPGQGITARVKVAPAAAQVSGAARASGASADVAAAAGSPDHPGRSARAASAERAVVDLALAPSAPAAVDGQTQGTNPVSVPGTSPTASAGMPRHDFAALVDRLVEARNAANTGTVQASVNHAEFGQVSLQFRQDGNDLSVSMSAADPDFAVAAQAAQAVMPADRQPTNADANARGQSQNQNSGQSAGQSSGQSQSAGASNHETAGQRGADGGDQQGRGNQGRNSRGGDPSNPSQRWSDRDQPQSRGGIFA